MEPRFDPEPDDAELQAILAALGGLADEERALDPYRSGWRRAGILESLDASDEG
jgi:hypothetical protein